MKTNNPTIYFRLVFIFFTFFFMKIPFYLRKILFYFTSNQHINIVQKCCQLLTSYFRLILIKAFIAFVDFSLTNVYKNHQVFNYRIHFLVFNNRTINFVNYIDCLINISVRRNYKINGQYSVQGWMSVENGFNFNFILQFSDSGAQFYMLSLEVISSTSATTEDFLEVFTIQCDKVNLYWEKYCDQHAIQWIQKKILCATNWTGQAIPYNFPLVVLKSNSCNKWQKVKNCIRSVN